MRQTILCCMMMLAFSVLNAQTSTKIKMADFMGANTNVASYDNKYVDELSKCVKWVREYHDWSHYEAANNYYKWDNITTQPQGWTWPEHTDFMKECRKYGINVLIDVLGVPSWVSSTHIPNNTGTGANASDYIERLEFMGQLVARYGSRKFTNEQIESADNVSGLNYIKYYEDDNEPDFTWYTPRWSAENYAKYCNAVHDGFGVTPDAEHPLLGIKSVDPDAKHVMAGMATTDSVYMNNVLKASNGRVPFDVLNVHCYTTDMTNAYSPEHEKYGYETVFRNFFKWRNRVLPALPVWITEVGWDTYLAPDGKHSYTYAPAQAQANYILRAYLILLKMGFEKSFLFMDTDTDSKGLIQYSTSGLLTDKASAYQKKISYYYLATMQNILGNTEYSKTMTYKTVVGTNEIYCLEFNNPLSSEKVYALWTRIPGSKNDNGTKKPYQFNPGYKVDKAYSVIPVDKDMDGDTLTPVVADNMIELNLSETPQFVVVAGNTTSSEVHPAGKFEMNVYPNPAEKEVQISLSVPNRQKVNLSAYSNDGKLLKTMVNGLMEQGIHHYQFGSGQLPGTYMLSLNTDSEYIVRKVILIE